LNIHSKSILRKRSHRSVL